MTDHSYSASTSSTWYIDSEASIHMTGAREMFSELSQTETNVEVVLGDDSSISAVGHGTITFQRESMTPMVLLTNVDVDRQREFSLVTDHS